MCIQYKQPLLFSRCNIINNKYIAQIGFNDVIKLGTSIVYGVVPPLLKMKKYVPSERVALGSTSSNTGYKKTETRHLGHVERIATHTVWDIVMSNRKKIRVKYIHLRKKKWCIFIYRIDVNVD